MIKSIVAKTKVGNIFSAKGVIPWRIKADMDHFKEKTMGNVCIMGRTTWELIPEKFRPLKGRCNIILTSKEGYPIPEIDPSDDETKVFVAKDLTSAIAMVNRIKKYEYRDIYICGGARPYRDAMDLIEEIEVTDVDADLGLNEGDQFLSFPEIDPKKFHLLSSSNQESDGYSYDFQRFIRIKH